MRDTIGKYRILAQIGRGGMGTIYRAHDPILDRAVALKVISGDVELTDELRARFFREAQACARLSHPNIVTVHDMGEDAGQLFIVMELLEGEELRRVIAKRPPLAIEDALSIMGQVSDGLHYAHQRGIVHRDIKPANIFVISNGRVKILDFGIARIETPEAQLTRTGLIMGTLRYMSPEQLRGRADARSDMFSAGAVFYELLSGRPPFAGEDPVQLLDQIRTEDPPRLDQVDPSIGPELATVVARAMRKDPTERFADLAEMRARIDHLQHDLAEEARQVRARVRAQRDELAGLERALGERIGTPNEATHISAPDERGPLAVLRPLERDIALQIEALREKIARADALSPALARGTELLKGGRLTEAVAELERVVADMPEHARAVDALGQARGEADRRRTLVAKLLEDARTALTEGGHSLCLALLKQADEAPAPRDMRPQIESLRATAEAELTAREAAGRALRQAEQARERMTRACQAAQAWAAPQRAAALWSEAEAKGAAAHEEFARGSYVGASGAFDEAAALYRRSEEHVHQLMGAGEPTDTMTPSAGSASSIAAAPTTASTVVPPTGPDADDDRVDTLPAVVGQKKRSRGRRMPVVIAASGGLAVLALVLTLAYWPHRPAPPEPGPAIVSAPPPAPDATPAKPAAAPPDVKPEPAPATRGSLAITSKVAGVEVRIGDQKIGATRPGSPLIAGDLPPGRLRLKATKPNHQDWEQDVVVAADERREVVIDIKPLGLAKVIKGDDGAEMTLVPEGAFSMGSSPDEITRVKGDCQSRYSYPEETCRNWFDHEGPVHRVVLDAFYLDKYEVTNARFERFVRASAYRTTAEQLGDSYVWRRKEGKWQAVRTEGADWRRPGGPGTNNIASHPVVHVGWADADRYCRWAGKRLPTEAEWEKAARGVDGRRYPWGWSWVPSNANAEARLGNTTPVGSYPTGVSPYGVHDMSGNVTEWVADSYEANYYQRSPERNPRGPEAGTYRVSRGGQWFNGPPWLRGAYRVRERADGRSDVLGFRCAKNA